MTGHKKKWVRNYNINLRVSASEKKYLKDLSEKLGESMTETLLRLFFMKYKNLILPKGTIMADYQAHKTEEYDMSMVDYCIQRTEKKITWVYHAMRDIKKCIAKSESASPPAELKKLVALFLYKAEKVYHNTKYVQFFKGFKRYLDKTHLYVHLRQQIRQASADRVQIVIDNIMRDDEERKKQGK